MKKLALMLAVTLFMGLMLSLCSVAEEVIIPEYEVLKENPVRTIGVDCYEVLDNTSFEMMDSPEALFAWGFTPRKVVFGTEFAERSRDAHSGDYAVLVKNYEDNYSYDLLGQCDIQEGETYEFSIWYKPTKGSPVGSTHLIFSGSAIAGNYAFERVKMNFHDVQVGSDYVKRTVRFVAPTHSRTMQISVRTLGPGEALWDDVSLLHITDKMPTVESDPIYDPISFIDVKNGGFENDTVGEAPKDANGWSAQYEKPVISGEYVHGGEKSVKLQVPPGKTDSLVCQYIGGFEKGARYQVSAFVRNPEENKVTASFWFYWSSKDFFDYNDTGSQLGVDKKTFTIRKNADWEQIVFEFTPPEDAKSAEFNIRLRPNPGVLYVDDVSVYMIKLPYVLDAETDHTFYYSEWEKGVCTASILNAENPASLKAEFTLQSPEGTPLHSESFSDITKEINYTFPTALMAEKGKRYHINLKVYAPDGATLQDQLIPVYRFDRPTYLGADGVFRKNGKEYTITLGTGARMDIMAKNPKEGGVTVLQIISDDSGLSLIEKMDKAYEEGYLVLVNLYSGFECAGTAERLPKTRETVSLVKDHPALFGYYAQDEPYQKAHTPEEMIAGYETIRNIDPHHPVYICDSVVGKFDWLFRYSDMVEIDNYGASHPDTGRIMSDIMDECMEASKGQKPFMIVQQAFRNIGYLPTVDELRHIAYQSFFSGACGYTFHSLSQDGVQEMDYIDRPQWQEIAEKWGKWERDFMYGCFVTGEYKFVNYQKTNDTLWATFTDGSDLYAIVLNRDEQNPKDVTIPLSDAAGMLSIGGYTARTMTGESKRLTGETALTLSLSPLEAVVWKITPHTKVDASALKTSAFRDTISYPWAYQAIASLEEKGIINRKAPNWYGPQENITRGDYAMFLVRALGLTGGGENFADVDPEAEYAKELAIGKANGVINGIGDNKFNPEAEITRQDMMTMTSRAMRLAGAADLGAFSDSGIIADYAASHVSAMVAEGLIKGNADGTINPLGNTTRAEAAVIMNRILNK
ncbi:MAG: S-layer homology domain-containing protein [Clostridia bacterium]|nr:S-layer homology domain-containing protein [Clostridia bacterium]